MINPTKTLIAAIADFNIYVDKNHVFTACFKIVHDGEIFKFGGEELFSLVECNGDSKYFLHFLDRSMQVNNTKRLNDLIGALIKIQVIDSHILGMSSLLGTEWFFPQLEFEVLKNAEHQKTAKTV